MPANNPRATRGVTRSLWAIPAAILLPLLIYLLISFGLSYRSQRLALEADTLHRAAEIVNDIDAELNATAATMRTLATIRSIRAENWAEARSRSREIAALHRDWRNVALIDLDRGVQLYSLTSDAVDRSLDAAPLRIVARHALGQPIFGGVRRSRSGQAEILAYLAVTGAEGRPLLLVVALSSDMVQRIVAPHAAEGVIAVADRSGRFVARSLAYAERVGTPATRYVRAAIKRGPSGLYSGVTWEGLENYTGYMTSARTGWSVHIGVSSGLFDSPERWWLLSSGLAALASVALGLLFLWLTLGAIRRERATDARIHQAERLETAGKLVGGVAHDFNNMLAIIQGSLDIAQLRLARGERDIGRYLDNAVDGTQRAADLTRRLLAFSRRRALTPVAVNANAVISGMRDLLARTLSEGISLTLDLDEALDTILVDPTLLENAIVNLAVNARDAMPSGGALTVETRRVDLKAREKPFPPASGRYACIAVRDSGSGMTPEVLAKAFEPFFTTKADGKGTGLGLAQVHGFVSQSGGFVDVRSQPGMGTCVALYLPAHAGPAISPVRLPTEAMPRARDGEAILLVEDEARLRETSAEALRDLGYAVHEAGDGAQALDRLADEPEIALLLTDIVMPGMSGIALAQQARAARPDLRILYMTGFERDAADSEMHGGLLRKPFTMDVLARRVRMVLDEGPRPD